MEKPVRQILPWERCGARFPPTRRYFDKCPTILVLCDIRVVRVLAAAMHRSYFPVTEVCHLIIEPLPFSVFLQNASCTLRSQSRPPASNRYNHPAKQKPRPLSTLAPLVFGISHSDRTAWKDKNFHPCTSEPVRRACSISTTLFGSLLDVRRHTASFSPVCHQSSFRMDSVFATIACSRRTRIRCILLWKALAAANQKPKADPLIYTLAFFLRFIVFWSRLWDSNPRPAAYKTAALPLSQDGACPVCPGVKRCSLPLCHCAAYTGPQFGCFCIAFLLCFIDQADRIVCLSGVTVRLLSYGHIMQSRTALPSPTWPSITKTDSNRPYGAANGIRTRGLLLGRQALFHLSYCRMFPATQGGRDERIVDYKQKLRATP